MTTTAIMLLGLGSAAMLLAIVGLSVKWFQDRAIKKIQQEYAQSLEAEYLKEDQALSEVVYDIDIQQTKVIHYSNTVH